MVLVGSLLIGIGSFVPANRVTPEFNHTSKAEPVTSPTVSVIVPAYNTAPFIAETIASILAQSYANYEIIVVNDGSPDTPALEAALAPFRDRIHYIVQPNRGLSGARNTGIARRARRARRAARFRRCMGTRLSGASAAM